MSSVDNTTEMIEINNGLRFKLVDWEFLMYYELHQEMIQLFAVQFFFAGFWWVAVITQRETEREQEEN